MAIEICTWNINSVRLREGLVLDLLREAGPDILCLQETKSPVEKIPTEGFAELGYTHIVARGQKGYNGVMILSRLPIEDAGRRDFCHKLDFLSEMRDWFGGDRPEKAILVGDLNIAPREDDVWSHKQLLKVVSHTPIEVEHLGAAQEAGGWVDITRADIPEGQLYSWWSYRARDWAAADRGRRLDHIWATPDLAAGAGGSRIDKHVRGWEKPSDHAPVFATFDL